jgi:NitT/TauT family transport system substrate-binding protein
MPMTRRRALALTAAVAAVPHIASAQANEPVIVHVGTQPAEFSADLFYGIDTGIFQRAGLSIDLQMLANGAQTSAAIVAGALNLGLADPLSVALAQQRGLDLVFIAPGCGFAMPWPLAWVTRADAGIVTAKDFNGKTIGTNGIKNAPSLMALYWIDHNGGDSQSVKWVEIPFSTAIGAIQEKRIDGELMAEPFLSQAREAGMHVTGLDHNTSATRWMVNGWVASRAWANANPALVKRFVAAMYESNHWGNTHTVETYPIIAKYTKLPEAVIPGMVKHPWIEQLSAPLVQPVLDTATRYGVLTKTVAATDLFYAGH